MTNPFFIRSASITGRDEYYAWGLHQVAKAVSFLNNDCKLVSILIFCTWILIRWSTIAFSNSNLLCCSVPCSLSSFSCLTSCIYNRFMVMFAWPVLLSLQPWIGSSMLLTCYPSLMGAVKLQVGKCW